jgi:hypothetical protein
MKDKTKTQTRLKSKPKTKLKTKPKPIKDKYSKKGKGFVKVRNAKQAKRKKESTKRKKNTLKKLKHLKQLNGELQRLSKNTDINEVKSANKLEHCSPHISAKKTGNKSCFDDTILLELIDAWNASNPKNPIDIGNDIDNDLNKIRNNMRNNNQKNNDRNNQENNNNNNNSKYNAYLWDLLNQKMSSKCDTEVCWVNKKDIKKHIDINTFKKIRSSIKPLKPKKWDKNKREWLNTLDIAGVMRQYELKYPDFKFMGPVPIDFDLKTKFDSCMISNLCKINLKKMMNDNIYKLGVIFNLDKHTQSGSHWIAMYMDIQKNIIGYWDSYGYKPPKEVKVLMNRLKEQGRELEYSPKIRINKKRHQFKGSECGVYSMHFIIEQLKGKSFKEITEQVIKDDDMWKNRQKYFIYKYD